MKVKLKLLVAILGGLPLRIGGHLSLRSKIPKCCSLSPQGLYNLALGGIPSSGLPSLTSTPYLKFFLHGHPTAHLSRLLHFLQAS